MQTQMYAAQINSPMTQLSAAIDAVQNTIPLVDASVVPAGSNLCTIGSDETAETIAYVSKSGNTLTGVTRGFQSAAKAWASGAKVARYLTAYDMDTVRQNLTDHESRMLLIEAGYPINAMSRQAIINGNFDVWQRGTSLAAAAARNYLADRWVTLAQGSTIAPSQQAFGVGQIVVPNNPKYFHRSVVASVAGAGNRALLTQYNENVANFQGQTISLSFWAKADANKNIAIEFQQYFGSGGAPSAFVPGIGSQKFALTTSWQKFTTQIAIPAITGKVLGTGGDDSLSLNFWFDAGANWNTNTATLGQQSGTFDIAQVQINAGSVALPFQPRDAEEETRKCLRFNRRLGGNTFTSFGVGYVLSATQAAIFVPFGVRMRIAPSLTSGGIIRLYNGGTTFLVTGIAINSGSQSQDGMELFITVASGLTVGQSIVLQANNDATAFLNFDGEL